MQILFVSHSLPPVDRPLSNVGGMQRVASKLHDELAAHPDVTLSSVLLRSPWRWVHLRVVPFLARAAWQIRRAVRRDDVDVVLGVVDVGRHRDDPGDGPGRRRRGEGEHREEAVPGEVVAAAQAPDQFRAAQVRRVDVAVEVHLDGGIRSGQDVLKALAMGAKGTYIGRAFVYGLGAMGQRGVETALEVIHKELDTSMALCGERKVGDLGPKNLLVPQDFEGRWQN